MAKKKKRKNTYLTHPVYLSLSMVPSVPMFFFPFWLPFNATNLILHFFPIALGATFTDPTSGGIFPGWKIQKWWGIYREYPLVI